MTNLEHNRGRRHLEAKLERANRELSWTHFLQMTLMRSIHKRFSCHETRRKTDPFMIYDLSEKIVVWEGRNIRAVVQ